MGTFQLILWNLAWPIIVAVLFWVTINLTMQFFSGGLTPQQGGGMVFWYVFLYIICQAIIPLCLTETPKQFVDIFSAFGIHTRTTPMKYFMYIIYLPVMLALGSWIYYRIDVKPQLRKNK